MTSNLRFSGDKTKTGMLPFRSPVTRKYKPVVLSSRTAWKESPYLKRTFLCPASLCSHPMRTGFPALFALSGYASPRKPGKRTNHRRSVLQKRPFTTVSMHASQAYNSRLPGNSGLFHIPSRKWRQALGYHSPLPQWKMYMPDNKHLILTLAARYPSKETPCRQHLYIILYINALQIARRQTATAERPVNGTCT